MSVYRGKSNCKVITIAAWYLGQIPGGVSVGKAPQIFWLFHVFDMIKQCTMTFKQPVFLANISTSDNLQYLILQKSNYVKGALGIAVP